MATLEFPTRGPSDGEVKVELVGATIFLCASNDGARYTISVSRWNAWRLTVMLMFVLGIPIPKSIAKFKMG